MIAPSFFVLLLTIIPSHSYGAYEYIGCYNDEGPVSAGGGGRAMIDVSFDRTFEGCVASCSSYDYFAPQNGLSQCFCGDDYSQITRYGVYDGRMWRAYSRSNCYNVGTNVVGGWWTNAVYKYKTEWFQIKFYHDFNNCVDVSGYGTYNGANVQLWTCHGGDNQLWRYDHGGMLIGKQSGKCLDVDYATQNVQIWDCHGGSNQRWRYDTNAGGKWVGERDNKCLAAAGGFHGNRRDGTNIFVENCYHSWHQMWTKHNAYYV